MLAREEVPLPRHHYPADEWRLIEARFDHRHLDRAETIFSLSNGYLGIRGTLEDSRPGLQAGTFVNAFHETWPIVHAEEAYGLARTGQTIVNVPDATVLKLYVDDEPLYLPVARVQDYARVLDFRAGTLSREFMWHTPAGKTVHVRSERLVSLEHRHLAAIRFEVTLVNAPAPVCVSSQVINRQDSAPGAEPRRLRPTDPRLAKEFGQRVLNTQLCETPGRRILLGHRTTNSRMTLGIGVEHVIETDAPHEIETFAEEDLAKLVLTADAQPGVPIRITKYLTYQTSRSVPPRELVDRCQRTLDRGVREGFGSLLASQRRHLDAFWDRADVEVVDSTQSVRTQQAVRWNLFQLAQASWRAEGTGIPAKGLTGQAYEGHYFWDTEVYVLPFLAYTQPRIARNLLRFRYTMLAQARERAIEMSQRGALFPWRSINGEEASGYYQAGTAQYHINADIVLAMKRYVEVTVDASLIVNGGAEVLVETARLWISLGFYDADGVQP
jgi:alpha,alpha-trehalose phosphorylase